MGKTRALPEAVRGDAGSASTSLRTPRVALVGESGSARASRRCPWCDLLPENADRSAAQYLFDGRDLLQAATD